MCTEENGEKLSSVLKSMKLGWWSYYRYRDAVRGIPASKRVVGWE
jgi:hypothetical protein